MEIIIKKPLGLASLKDLNLDNATLRRATVGVVKAVKESFGDAETISKKEAEHRVNVAVRFILRCVGDGRLTMARTLAFLGRALPVELAGLEYPIPSGAAYSVPE